MSQERYSVPLVDAIKAVAAQLIVLHHLAWYWPMGDGAAGLAPWLARGQAWLAEHGRYAVAAFLAVGGYLAAAALAPRALPPDKSPLCLIGQRYMRLAAPYTVALLLAILGAAWARQWMEHESIGAAPDVWRVLAHLLLLHDLLGYEALSAGVWYVAIDFQLFALLVLLLWAARLSGRHRPAGADFFAPLLVAALALASLFHFNRDAAWDDTALYFFGAYALGVGSCWAVRSAMPYRGLLAVALIGGIALSVDFRPRLVVALGVALAIGLAQLHPRLSGRRPLAGLGRTSYALFLVHFPVCLVVSAAMQRFAPEPARSLAGLLLAWGASNVAAVLFHRHVERRLARWRPSLPPCLAIRQAC